MLLGLDETGSAAHGAVSLRGVVDRCTTLQVSEKTRSGPIAAIIQRWRSEARTLLVRRFGALAAPEVAVRDVLHLRTG